MGNACAHKKSDISEQSSDVREFDGEQCLGRTNGLCVKKYPVWETNLIKNCESLGKKCLWATALKAYVYKIQLSRNNFLREFYDFKEKISQDYAETPLKAPLNSSEVQDFRSSLKKSVLLSYGPENEMQADKIESILASKATRREGKKKKNYTSQFKQSVISNDTPKYNRNSIGSSINSFIDDSISQLLQEKPQQISKESAHMLETFIKFTMLMQKHLKDPRHKICQLIRAFYNYLFQTYGSMDAISAETMTSIVDAIKTFLVLLKQSVEDYYRTRNFEDMFGNTNYLISNSDNILTAVTTIFFKEEEFYKFMYELVNRFNSQRRNSLKPILHKLSNRSPQSFYIKSQYCLNSSTIKSYIESMSSIESTIENLQPELLEIDAEQPYMGCIQSLRKIRKARTPVSKMKMILECAEKISQSVMEFYDSNNLTPKNRMMDADQVVSIFCYLVARAGVEDIHTHLFFIEHFATEDQLISASGHYYTLTRVAVEHLQNQHSQF